MPKIPLNIEYDPQTHGITVEGPLNDPLICYGMLEMARDLVAAHQRKHRGDDNGGGPRILVPQLVPPTGPIRG